MTTSKESSKKQQQIYVKSKVSKNFVQAPYSIIDASNISPTARMLWIYLESNSSEYLPDRKTISEHLGMTPKTVTAAKNTLLKHNMIFLEEVETKYKKIKHHLYTQDPSVWVDVVFKNNRSNNAGVKITPAAGVKITPAAGVKITPNNREQNIKEIDSRGDTPNGTAKIPDTEHEPAKKATTTTTTKSIDGGKARLNPVDYSHINELTRHADPTTKNQLFNDALNRYGRNAYDYVIRELLKEDVKFYWDTRSSSDDIPHNRLFDVFDYAIKQG